MLICLISRPHSCQYMWSVTTLMCVTRVDLEVSHRYCVNVSQVLANLNGSWCGAPAQSIWYLITFCGFRPTLNLYRLCPDHPVEMCDPPGILAWALFAWLTGWISLFVLTSKWAYVSVVSVWLDYVTLVDIKLVRGLV